MLLDTKNSYFLITIYKPSTLLHQFIVAVPLFVGVQFVFTALLAYGLFHETLSLQGWLGVAIILFGISLLATGAK